jgi:hypothetical protein
VFMEPAFPKLRMGFRLLPDADLSQVMAPRGENSLPVGIWTIDLIQTVMCGAVS